jgi:4-hydroxybenzoyl-CoA reductase subunit beta
MDSLGEFRLLQPSTIAEAVGMRRAIPDSRWIAGGTDLIANLRRGIGTAAALIDLSRVGEMKAVLPQGESLRLGAGMTLADLAEDANVRRLLPVVAKAAAMVAGPSHRTSATLGGNLCLDTRCVFYNQSEWWRASNAFCRKYKGDTCHVAPTGSRCHAAYSGDLAPALMVLGASGEIVGPAGRRRLPLDQLFADDGEAHLRLERDEILAAVWVRPDPRLRTDYAKARLRGAIDFPLAGVAVALQRETDHLALLRVALTGTNSRPILIEGLEGLAGGPLSETILQALDKRVQRQVSPMRTTLAQPHYRRRVAAALARRLTASLFAAEAAVPLDPGD